MIKTFNQAVKFLEGYVPSPAKKHPGELGLKRMDKLVGLLGNPQLAYKTIHVGGTSGKGSVSTIIASILAQKYKIGLHTSPHLVKITERIKIGSKDISDNDFIDLLNEIYPTIKRIEESELGRPSYFEILACMAFLYFQEQKVDIAVIEVGMGGRYDATNVIRPLVAVITNVGLDHTDVLGETVEKIAEDKVGIVKPGISVVSGVKQSSVIEIVKSKIKDQKSKISLLGEDFRYKIKKIDENGCVFDYFGENTYRDLKISLLGRHQVENAAIALKAIELSNDDIDIRKGLISSYIPGRLEIVSRKPLVIFDGAHNVEKMKALVTAIKDIFPKKKVKGVIAIKSGKDAKGILYEIIPICHKIIFTKFRLTTDLGDTFSYETEELLEIAYLINRQHRYNSRYTKVVREMLVVDNAKNAVEKAIELVKPTDLILVTGSLYLIGELRKFLISNY